MRTAGWVVSDFSLMDAIEYGIVKIVVAGSTFGADFDLAVARLENDQFRFNAFGFTVGENGGTATLTVQRTGGSTGTVVVRAQTIGGTATPGLDYLGTTVDLVFSPGETTKSFTIPILGDAAVEGPETIEVRLQVVGGSASVGTRGTAVVTVLDDVIPPVTPVTPVVRVLSGKPKFHAATGRYRQVVRLVNASGRGLYGPLRLVLGGLSRRVKVRKAKGGVLLKAPVGSSSCWVNLNGSGQFAAGRCGRWCWSSAVPAAG